MLAKRSLRFAVRAPVWQAQNVCRRGHAAWQQAQSFLGRIPKPTQGNVGTGLTCTGLRVSLKNGFRFRYFNKSLVKAEFQIRKRRRQAVDMKFGV